MPKFVTFDDGKGTFNYRAIFPTNTLKKDILKAIEKKIVRKINSLGLDQSDFGWYKIKGRTKIVSMKEGKIYEPDASLGGHWNDIND